MTLKEIEKDFDSAWDKEKLDKNLGDAFKLFYQIKINSIIDEMIGEERENKYHKCDEEDCSTCAFNDGNDKGYNQKRQELIDFKKKFNE